MPRASRKDPLKLPQSGDSWILAVRRLRTWMPPEKGDKPVRPILMIVFNRNQHMVHNFELSEKSDPDKARRILWSAMTDPLEELETEAQRPARVIFEDRELLQALAPALEQIGVPTIYYPPNPELDEMVKELETGINGGRPDIAGLLAGKKVTPELVAELFAAAAEFYRATPWVRLSNNDVLAIRVLPQKEPYYLTVMGQGGVEYGLALYLKWADVERIYLADEYSMDSLPESGGHSLLFDEITDMPFDDLDALERFGWTVADPQAYPFPMVFVPPDRVERPGRDELLWYTAALRAIPEFVQKHLAQRKAGDLQPVQATVPVATSAGQVQVEIKVPAGDLPIPSQPAGDPGDEEDEGGEASFAFDRRAMEGQMARIGGAFGAPGGDPGLRKAQQLMYTAWEETNPAKRLGLARKALKASKDCADAYVLLAEEEAGSLEQAFEYYGQGVEAGEHALGPEFFEQNAGHFWGLLETRPYMRALEGMAQCLWRLKRRDEALATYRKMLALNPNDNQGMRYALLDLLLSLDRQAEAEKLVKQYKGDWSATWLYTEALLAFRKDGASKSAGHKLAQALDENEHVVDYLVRKKRIPGRMPGSIIMGDDTEAVDYAANHLNYWRSTPGAIEWLKSQVAKEG